MRTVLFVFIFFFIPFLCLAATINIPVDYPTIQEGIDAAVDGDTVLVAPGTYIENIDFIGKSITVKSDKGSDVTIIDCNQAGSAISFQSGEGLDSVLKGFTVTNGNALIGGGIYCDSASPCITNNTITGNSADNGGGISCYSSSPTITNNVISDNSASGWEFGGGGIYCDKSSPTIINNIISNNVATGDYGEGGGLFNNESNPIVYNCIFTGNVAGWYGAGIYNVFSNTMVINCTFTENSSGYGGGGMFNGGGSPTITNCIFCGNLSKTRGGAMYNGTSSTTVTNCSFSGNSSGLGGGGIYNFTNTTTVTNCILWGNVPSEIYINAGSVIVLYSCVQGGWTGTGNIDSDPLFVDPVKGDCHLSFPSPCKDTGDTSVVTELNDFEGDPRIAYGTVDMGADEFYPHLYYTGDATPSSTIQAKCIGIPGTLVNGIIMGVNIFDPPLPCDYGLWYMDGPMQIITGLGTIPANGVAVFPGTLSSTPPAPYTIYLQAAIDSWLTNLCPVNVQ